MHLDYILDIVALIYKHLEYFDIIFKQTYQTETTDQQPLSLHHKCLTIFLEANIGQIL